MKAIILGSSRGIRRLDSTKSYPAALVEDTRGQRVLDWLLAALAQSGVDDVSFIGGYHIEKVVHHYSSLQFYYNANWQTGNDLQAVHVALPELDGPCVLVRGDIVFHEPGTHRPKITAFLPVRLTTVLMIDDNPDVIVLFRRYLQGTNYHLVGILDGRQGIQLAETLKPDLILLDVMMPWQDGWQILRSLRATAATAATPIIVCSVLAQTELAFTMGADDLIQKPVSQQALLDALERWSQTQIVRRHQREDGAQTGSDLLDSQGILPGDGES